MTTNGRMLLTSHLGLGLRSSTLTQLSGLRNDIDERVQMRKLWLLI